MTMATNNLNMLLASNSTDSNYEDGYLDYVVEDLEDFLGSHKTVLLVPYALKDMDLVVRRVRHRFEKSGHGLESIHEKEDPIAAIGDAEVVFVSGGNTFRLVKWLYKLELIEPLRSYIEDGRPYIGSSAGTIICGPTMKTTNDMPIVRPPSFDTLGVLPFHTNPHYIDDYPEGFYHGETRELRLIEFLEDNNDVVLALYESSLLRVNGSNVLLKGRGGARIFRRGHEIENVGGGAILDYLITDHAR